MKVWHLVIALLAAPISGCVSVPPLGAEHLAGLKAGKTAVIAYDASKKITYTDNTFYGIGVARRDTQATYEGFFDLEKYLGGYFSRQLGQRGIQATAITLPTSAQDASFVEKYFKLTEMRVGVEPKDIEVKRAIPTALREVAVKGGFNYVFLVVTGGFSVMTTNFSSHQANVSISEDVYLYHVGSSALTWSSSYWTITRPIPFKESPKEIEENDFALLKPELERNVEMMFTIDAPVQRGMDLALGMKPIQ